MIRYNTLNKKRAMKKIYSSVAELVGKTPILELRNYSKKNHLSTALFGKLEYLNPSGSVKDRLAKALIEDAEERGILTADSIIIEPTSGNTGIGLASIATSKGYRCILTMPETMSEERRNILKAYGAELVLTDGSKGMRGAIAKAQELHENTPDSYLPGQFTNPVNGFMHEQTTAMEIWDDMDGDIDIIVAGVGTGGTISGIGRALKKLKPSIQVVAVEPEDSPVLSEGRSGAHRIQGIGAGFIPDTLDTTVYDEIITVSNDDAVSIARELGKTDGVLTGISSGAALHAATLIAQRTENAWKKILVILPDSADRYYSTALFIE